MRKLRRQTEPPRNGSRATVRKFSGSEVSLTSCCLIRAEADCKFSQPALYANSVPISPEEAQLIIDQPDLEFLPPRQDTERSTDRSRTETPVRRARPVMPSATAAHGSPPKSRGAMAGASRNESGASSVAVIGEGQRLPVGSPQRPGGSSRGASMVGSQPRSARSSSPLPDSARAKTPLPNVQIATSPAPASVGIISEPDRADSTPIPRTKDDLRGAEPVDQTFVQRLQKLSMSTPKADRRQLAEGGEVRSSAAGPRQLTAGELSSHSAALFAREFAIKATRDYSERTDSFQEIAQRALTAEQIKVTERRFERIKREIQGIIGDLSNSAEEEMKTRRDEFSGLGELRGLAVRQPDYADSAWASTSFHSVSSPALSGSRTGTRNQQTSEALQASPRGAEGRPWDQSRQSNRSSSQGSKASAQGRGMAKKATSTVGSQSPRQNEPSQDSRGRSKND